MIRSRFYAGARVATGRTRLLSRPVEAPATGGYRLQGTLLEACTCDVLCPCWIGEDPDGGTCQSIMAYHLDSGTINGVDVGGLTLAAVVFIPATC